MTLDQIAIGKEAKITKVGGEENFAADCWIWD